MLTTITTTSIRVALSRMGVSPFACAPPAISARTRTILTVAVMRCVPPGGSLDVLSMVWLTDQHTFASRSRCSCVRVVEGRKHIRWPIYKTQPAVQFTAELALRQTAIRERLSINQNARREEQSTLRGQPLPLRGTYIERRDREPVLAGELLQ